MKPRKPFPDEQAKLDALHAKFSAGHGIALFEALTLCWERGWLIPGWISGALVAGLRRFTNKQFVHFGEAFNIKPHASKSITKLRARSKMVDAEAGWPLAAVLKRRDIFEGSEIITNEERAARLARSLPDDDVAARTGLSAATVRRIRQERGIKKIGGRKKQSAR